MDLILWRHAEAEVAANGQADADRKLTRKGQHQAERMAAWLNRRLPTEVRVLVSPAVRTQETAQYLGRDIVTEPALALTESAASALAAAGWPHGPGCCLLVGHQPTLGRVIAQLMQTQQTDWSVKKGGVWWFTQALDAESGTLAVQLLAVQNPKHL